MIRYPNGKYFIDRDGDGHWFLIPADKRWKRNQFLNLDPQDEAAWEVPEWAKYLNSGPASIIFENPIKIH